MVALHVYDTLHTFAVRFAGVSRMRNRLSGRDLSKIVISCMATYVSLLYCMTLYDVQWV